MTQQVVYRTIRDVIHSCLRVSYLVGQAEGECVPESIDELLWQIEIRGMPEWIVMTPEGHFEGRWQRPRVSAVTGAERQETGETT